MKSRKLNEQGVAHYLLLFLMVVLIGAFAYIGAKRIISSHADTLGDFTYVATHPQAAAQPTAMGKNLLTLKAYNGKIYAGYGDYGANTGPIAITSLDPTTGSFATAPSFTEGTEQIDLYRVLNGKLFAAAVDPSAASPSSYYADADGNGSWSQSVVGKSGGLDLDHVFDIATLTGSDLWLAGSKGNDATVWHSTDGGTTWTKSLDLNVANRMERFYGIGAYNGKLYVQASSTDLANSVSYPLESTSHVYNGSSWSTGPSLGSGLYYFGHPETFAGKMIYTSYCKCNSAGSGPLYAFTGTSTIQTISAPGSLYDYMIDGTTLYALGLNGTVYSTTDLTNWYVQRTGVTTARSLTVLNGQIYVGTSDSKVYKASVNSSPSAVGSTTGGTTSGTTSGGTTTKLHGGGSGGGNGGGHKK